jgi:hypothetical protein
MNINPNAIQKFANIKRTSFILNVDEVRNHRNKLLKLSDWTQMPDSPLSPEKKQEWAVYRQALRDMLNSAIDPASVVWPQEP